MYELEAAMTGCIVLQASAAVEEVLDRLRHEGAKPIAVAQSGAVHVLDSQLLEAACGVTAPGVLRASGLEPVHGDERMDSLMARLRLAPVPVVSPATSVHVAAGMLLAKGGDHLAVMHDGTLIGLVCRSRMAALLMGDSDSSVPMRRPSGAAAEHGYTSGAAELRPNGSPCCGGVGSLPQEPGVARVGGVEFSRAGRSPFEAHAAHAELGAAAGGLLKTTAVSASAAAVTAASGQAASAAAPLCGALDSAEHHAHAGHVLSRQVQQELPPREFHGVGGAEAGAAAANEAQAVEAPRADPLRSGWDLLDSADDCLDVLGLFGQAVNADAVVQQLQALGDVAAGAAGAGAGGGPGGAGWLLKYVYDGNCGLCRAFAGLLERLDGGAGNVAFANVAEPAFDALQHGGINLKAAWETVHVLTANGQVLKGGVAALKLLFAVDPDLAAAAGDLPQLLPLLSLAALAIARHRHTLAGGWRAGWGALRAGGAGGGRGGGGAAPLGLGGRGLAVGGQARAPG